MKDETEEQKEQTIQTPATTAEPQDGNPAKKKTGKQKPQRPPSNSRGPTPGKYQNGKVCFSAWLPTPFLVRLRRYAANLGLDLPTLIMNDYSPRLDSIRLTQSDQDEISLSNQSIRT